MRTEVGGFRVVSSGSRPGAVRLDQPDLRLVAGRTARAVEEVAPPARPDVVGSALLDAQCLEGLLLNLDASLRVTTQPQFFSWTQGLLLNLIRHKVLLCALRRGGERGFTVDSFSTSVAAAGSFGDALTREASLISVLADRWAQRHFQPFICGMNEVTGAVGSTGLRELVRTGASQLLVHGSHDVDGEVLGLTIFACQEGAAGPRELYLVQLLNPALHTAWVRAQTRRSPADSRSPAGTGCILTDRERGILRWVYLGKSNGEIGAILGISALTVKNHVQKILRKLNVVNRAQAVGRALDARIIRP